MLEQREDEIDTKPPPPPLDNSPVSADKDAENRVVYKLVRVGDDGTVLPATEDEVMQVESMVGGGSVLEPSDADASDANEYEGEDENSEDEQDSDAEENDEKETTSCPEVKDFDAERKRLLAHLQVLDTMLLNVKAEEQQRVGLDGLSDGAGHESGPYLTASFGSGECKRQRRPNPKYTDSGDDLSIPCHSRVAGADALTSSVATEKQSPQTSINPGTYGNAPGMSLRSFRSSSQRTRMTRVLPSYSKLEGSGVAAAAALKSSLDNLSIRELHATYRKTFNRDTSVKDKHWLKRQISMGLLNHAEAADSVPSLLDAAQDPSIKARLEKISSAEAPLPPAGALNVRTAAPDSADGANTFDSLEAGEIENKRFIRKTVPLSVVSPTGPLDASTMAGLGSTADANSLFTQGDNNSGQSGGKRQRKPNRRYIEDETEDLAAILNGARPCANLSELGSGQGSIKSAMRSWTNSDGPADSTRQGSLRSSSLARGSPQQAAVSQGTRTKQSNNVLKRKVEGRAAKLVKMAHSARAARQEVDSTVRKVKFRVPPAPGQQEDEVSEFNGLEQDQVSCLLPLALEDGSNDLQGLLIPENRVEENNEQVATVPTANGGTRRKHHRPWTLREVMTLVEGVARCGGGKWADIKKLAFSTVGYRTAVDLKDKWRNLLRASRVQLHPPKQGERKKQFTASIPAPILARVRELAAIQNQTSATVTTGTSRSGRAVHRK